MLRVMDKSPKFMINFAMKNNNSSRVRITQSIKSSAQPKGILVLGMHRSGTSAFTRVLNLLGCALPDNLIGGGDGNETGHWEAISVVSLNDQIFTSAGSRWDDWGPLNDDWRKSSLRDDMLQKAAVLIEDHTDLGSLFAIKDPRLCRLADVWLAAMDEAKVEPSVVVMVRNPAEVIASLESRDLMAPGYSQLLWLRHALDAEFFSRGSNRVVCRYDQLMSNWFSVIDRVRTGLGITLPRNSPSVHLEIEQYLNDEHRHHEIPLEAVIDNPALSDWLRRTFAIMVNWSEEGEASSDYAELDQIRLEFDRSYSTFARLLLPGDLTGGAGLGPSIKRELTDAQQALQNAELASQETEVRLSLAADREAEITAEVARLETEVAAANSDIEREAQHRQALEAQLTDAQQALQNAEIASQETGARLSASAAREAEIMAEVARLEAEVAAANSDVEREAQDRQALEAQLTDAQQALQNVEIASQETEARLSASAAREAEIMAEVARLEAEVAAANSDIEREAQHRQALEAQLTDAQQALQNAEIASQETEVRLSLAADREAEITAEVARLEAEVAAANSDVEREGQHRQALEAQLTEVEEKAREHELRNADLLGRLAVAESTMIQRQEELAQLMTRLLESETASAQARAKEVIAQEQLVEAKQAIAEANEQIEAMAQRSFVERDTAEVKVARLETEIVQITQMLQKQEEEAKIRQGARELAEEALAAVQEQLVEANQAIAVANEQIEAMAQRSFAERDTAEVKVARLETEVAQITQMLQKQEEEAKLTQGARALAEEALAAQQNKTNHLDAELQQLQVAKDAAESARAVADQKVADRFAEIARLTSILSDEGAKVDQARANAEWLRSALQLAASFPKWWAIMPQKWRRKREHARYRNSELLDAERYLEAYPDVAEYGMDPVRHYVLHGMREGREIKF
jgi:hypothetical protein